MNTLKLPQELVRRLLAIGGQNVKDDPAFTSEASPQYQTFVSLLLGQGREFNGKRISVAASNLCHVMSSALFLWSGQRVELWTGWALGDGTWVRHSWNVFGDKVYESNGQWTRYFGIRILNPKWAENELRQANKWQDDPQNYGSLFLPDALFGVSFCNLKARLAVLDSEAD